MKISTETSPPYSAPRTQPSSTPSKNGVRPHLFPNGSTWMTRMQDHIYDLGRNGATVDGRAATMVLDMRVQPGGLKAAQPLINYGRQNGVTVIVKEFK